VLLHNKAVTTQTTKSKTSKDLYERMVLTNSGLILSLAILTTDSIRLEIKWEDIQVCGNAVV